MNKTSMMATPIKRILLIKLRHHGDMLLITPVINTLKKNYPTAQIDVLLYQQTQEMLIHHPALSRLFTIDRQWKEQGSYTHFKHMAGLLYQLKAQHYDLVVNLADQWYSALISYFTRAPHRLGFDFPKRRGALWSYCHTHLQSVLEHNTLHTVEQNLSVLNSLHLPEIQQQCTVYYSHQDWQTAQTLLQKKGSAPHYIVVQPTSRWFFKCWSEKKMAATIDALQTDGHQVLITSGPDEQEQAMVRHILALCSQPNTISLAGQLTLCQLAALIDHADLFIGVDSVPMHMAAALHTPCIALFGPSKLAYWRPWQAVGQVIWAGDYGDLPDPDAIDTTTNTRYLDLIPTDAVIAAARSALV